MIEEGRGGGGCVDEVDEWRRDMEVYVCMYVCRYVLRRAATKKRVDRDTHLDERKRGTKLSRI